MSQKQCYLAISGLSIVQYIYKFITKKRPLTSKTTSISNNGSHVRVVSIERQIVTIVVTYWADCQLCCHFGYRHCMNEQT